MSILNKYFKASSPQNDSSFWEIVNPEESYQFELIDVPWWRKFIYKNWAWGFYGSAVYLAAIFGLRRYMKNRAELNLRYSLAMWNGLLGVFSILGFVRTAPVLLDYLINEKGVYRTLCYQDKIAAQVAFWTVMFAVSKFVELGDTVFIVLRKRPLQLLQWYHHIITLISVWLITPDAEPLSVCFVVMNYGVHSVMYPYFALTMVGVKVPRLIAKAITTAQLAQMVAAFLLNVITIGLLVTGTHCHRTPTGILVSSVGYGSFVVLFGKLFRNNVLPKGWTGKRPKNE